MRPHSPLDADSGPGRRRTGRTDMARPIDNDVVLGEVSNPEFFHMQWGTKGAAAVNPHRVDPESRIREDSTVAAPDVADPTTDVSPRAPGRQDH